jgi:hypothetical protein
MGAALAGASLSTACSKFVRSPGAAAAVGGFGEEAEEGEVEEGEGDVEMDGPAAGEGLLLVQEAARLQIANAGR